MREQYVVAGDRVRYDLTTREQRRASVVAHRTASGPRRDKTAAAADPGGTKERAAEEPYEVG